MFRLIKIVFNACLIVLAFIGFNAIGGEKYTEQIKTAVINFIEEHRSNIAGKLGDFTNIDKEFQIDNAVNLLGYKAVLAEHKASGQKMVIVDSGKKPLLTHEDIKNGELDVKLKKLSEKIKYQGITVKDLSVTERGEISIYGQTVPYAKFKAHVTKLPVSDVGGIVAGVKTSDGNEKLALSFSEDKKYSHLITKEFFKSVHESEQK